ncbi:cyclin-D5-1-like [Mangifera indica]|uniref:cyclin-D5-1-like n=1 Tax=Mangifera indica TaxID=29780 RepID=UPI001CFC1042|nr:cyclin-D5-1-like [Mangifera indica]XP_044492423.1 cyclin-D5-1-like [Mangifera indica]
MADSDLSSSASSLLCFEDGEPCVSHGTQLFDMADLYNSCFVLEDDDEEFIQLLVQKETLFGSKNGVFSDVGSYQNQTWLRSARLDSIQWMFNRRAMFGFHFHTAYLSVDYFDRFLAKRSIDEGKLWAIRLLSVACLTLAAKMEECKVPSLSEFYVEDFDFENKLIQRMEQLVLSTLEWKMGSVTPFKFLGYFISKICGEDRPKELVCKAVELIVTITREINLMDHRPSMIAAAAVLAASDADMTRQAVELKMNFVSSWDSLEIEHIHTCYNIMHELEMGKLKTPSRDMSSPSTIGIFEVSRFTSGADTKRRLTYTDQAQNGSSKKICRP